MNYLLGKSGTPQFIESVSEASSEGPTAKTSQQMPFRLDGGPSRNATADASQNISGNSVSGQGVRHGYLEMGS